MVTGFSMESQDKRMCKTETVFSGATVDYNTHRAYDDEDCFGDILNLLDFPMESLEGDGFAEDWASKLGPIPSEVFKEVMAPPPPSQISNNNNSTSHNTDLPIQHPVQTTLVEDKRLYPSQASFEAPSPKSVLESRTTSLNNKPFPVKTRTKRARPTANANPWLMSPFMVLPEKVNNGKKPVTMEAKRPLEVKKCAHCEITRTPQWREGPMGPKTLCNACGVWYRSGRLYPEYRPAASPTFVKDVHSDSHRKVIENNGKKPVTMEAKRPLEVKKCAHCEITRTPQWREGPMGPKTLCNACGVRYRSGRLYPEYRPAASPTFVTDLHSNSHRKVIEMRQKTVI